MSGNYFTILQVGSALGRTFGPSEDGAPGASPAVVISHRYWLERFAGDPRVLNRTITINNVPLTVVGVAAPGFNGEVVGQRIDVWLPITMQPIIAPHRPWLEQRDVNWLLGMGRLKPGVTVEQAQAAIAAIVYRVWMNRRVSRPRANGRRFRSRRVCADFPACEEYMPVAHNPDDRGKPGAAHHVRECREPHAHTRIGACA